MASTGTFFSLLWSQAVSKTLEVESRLAVRPGYGKLDRNSISKSEVSASFPKQPVPQKWRSKDEVPKKVKAK